jgi:hypothetical protein
VPIRGAPEYARRTAAVGIIGRALTAATCALCGSVAVTGRDPTSALPSTVSPIIRSRLADAGRWRRCADYLFGGRPLVNGERGKAGCRPAGLALSGIPAKPYPVVIGTRSSSGPGHPALARHDQEELCVRGRMRSDDTAGGAGFRAAS